MGEFDPDDTNNSYDTDGDGEADTGWRPLDPGETSGTFEDVDAGYDPEMPGDDTYHVPGGTTMTFDDTYLLPIITNRIMTAWFVDDSTESISPEDLDDTYGPGVDLPEYD